MNGAALDRGVNPVALAAVFAVGALTTIGVLFDPRAMLLVQGVLGIGVLWLLVSDLRKSVWLTLLLLFFGNRAEIPALVFWGRYLPTLGIILFVVAMALWLILYRQTRVGGGSVLVAMTAFATLVALSALYNDNSPRALLLSLLTNLRYPLFYVLLVTAPFDQQFFTRLRRAFVVLALLQIPIAIAQFAMGLRGDELSGTLGANGPLVAVVLVAQCELMAQWLEFRTHTFRYVAAILLLLVPIVLADVQIGLVFFPLLLCVVAAQRFGLRHSGAFVLHIGLILLVAAVLVASLFRFLPTLGRFLEISLPEYTTWSYWSEPSMVNTSSAGRLTIVYFSLPLVTESPVRALIGYGPETTSGGLIDTELTSQFDAAENAEGGLVCRLLRARGLICREPQSFRSLLEFGALGTLVYLSAFPLLLTRARRYRGPRGAGQAAAYGAFVGIFALYVVLGFWYTATWRLDAYSFPFWLWAAATNARPSPAPAITDPTT